MTNMTDYANFRQRLDAVLRTLDVKQVSKFLIAENQWDEGAYTSILASLLACANISTKQIYYLLPSSVTTIFGLKVIFPLLVPFLPCFDLRQHWVVTQR